jgi:signal transduction histidine kinase
MHRRRALLSLRWVASFTLGLFVAYTQPDRMSIHALLGWGVCLTMVLSNLGLHSIPVEAFRRQLLHFLVFLLDVVLVSVAVFQPDPNGLAFSVVLVLCILSGAVTGDPRSSFIFALCASVVYLAQMQVARASFESLLEPGTLLRIPLFLVFALTAGLLSRGAERSMRRRTETLLALDRRLSLILSPREVGQAVSEALFQAGHYRQVATYVLEPDQITLRRANDAKLPAVLDLSSIPASIADRLRRGDPVAPEQLEGAPEFARMLGTRRAATFVIPARFSDRPFGLIVAESKVWILEPESETTFLMHVGERGASAIMNARMMQNAQEAVIGLHSLLKMSEAVTSSLRIRDILTLLEDFSRSLVGVRACRLWVVPSALGQSLPEIAGDKLPASGETADLVALGPEAASVLELAAARRVKETGSELFLNSPDAVANLVPSSGVQNLMALPLRTATEVLGVLEAIDKPSPFDQRDHSLLAGLASQATVALVNARLYEGLEERAARITRLVDTLGAEKQKLEHVLSNMEEGVVLLDGQGEVVLLNHAGRRLLAPSGRLRLPAPAASFEDPLHLLPRLGAVLGGQDSIHATLSAGDRFYGLSAARLKGQDGAIAVLRDITELVRMDALRSDFVSHVSHELRTPLAAIIGSIKLILDGRAGDLTETQDRLLNIVERESGRLMYLINDLLDLAKLEAGRTRIELEQADLALVIAEAVEAIQPLATSRTIQISTQTDGLRGTVPCDPALIRQVLQNLIGNALKFTPEGGSVKVEAATGPDSVKVLTIDTGIGIPRDKWEAVFNKFEQVGAHQGPVKGTGLGLAICRQIIDRHSGRIWVESEEGVGSTFTFTLPLVQSDQAPTGDRQTPANEGDVRPAKPGKRNLARAA